MLNLHTQGRPQGGDHLLLASIVLVIASKSETLIFVLCLRTYSMKGDLIRGTKEERGSQVSCKGL